MKRFSFKLQISVLALLAIVLLGSSCMPSGEAKFTAVLPLSGSGEVYGQAVRKGIELAIDELDKDPSLPSLTIGFMDTASDPERAKELIDDAYDSGSVAVLGGILSSEAKAMVPVADDWNRVLLSPTASNPELSGISRNFYRVFPSDFLEGTKMGNFAAQGIDLENVVIVAKEDRYAKGIQQVFKAEFERYGGVVLEVVAYPEGTQDFSGIIDRVLTLKPQAVYLAAFADEIAAQIRELRSHEFEGRILTTAAFAATDALEEIGEAAEGVLLTQSVFDVNSDDETMKNFVEAYRQKHGTDPDVYSAHGYDAAMILVQAVLAGGALPNQFWKGMRSIEDYPGVTGSIRFDERGDVKKFPRVYTVENGILVDFERKIESQKRELEERLRKLRLQKEEAMRRRQQGDG